MAKANIKILESAAEIQEGVNKALAVEINKRLQKAAGSFKARIKPFIESALFSSPEISSLSGGTLAADFGLESDPSSAIVRAVVDSMEVKVVKATAKNMGGFELVMQPSNFANLLGLSVAQQPINGGSLPWLQWLLTAGDSIIIRNFGVERGPYGRTGKARMSGDFAPFKVDGRYSGTADNNFITRAVDKVKKQIEDQMKSVLY